MEVQTLVDGPEWEEIMRHERDYREAIDWYHKRSASAFEDQLMYANFEKTEYCRECPHC